MANQKDEKFNIERQYLQWVKLMGMTTQSMHPTQKIQLRQAFYGACGMMLVDILPSIGDLSDNEADVVINDMEAQLTLYWESQAKSGGH